jgi:hypothetical protein
VLSLAYPGRQAIRQVSVDVCAVVYYRVADYRVVDAVKSVVARLCPIMPSRRAFTRQYAFTRGYLFAQDLWSLRFDRLARRVETSPGSPAADGLRMPRGCDQPEAGLHNRADRSNADVIKASGWDVACLRRGRYRLTVSRGRAMPAAECARFPLGPHVD